MCIMIASDVKSVHTYVMWPVWVLWVFVSSGPMEGCWEDQLHLKGNQVCLGVPLWLWLLSLWYTYHVVFIRILEVAHTNDIQVLTVKMHRKESRLFTWTAPTGSLLSPRDLGGCKKEKSVLCACVSPTLFTIVCCIHCCSPTLGPWTRTGW